MQITSSVFKHNEQIPAKYTCEGDNVNPPLEFHNIPPSSESLVLIVDDPDAVSGTFTHWVVVNIDPTTTEVIEGSVPSGGIETITSAGNPGYVGPCPPSGTHRYFFKLYALDTTLTNLTPDSDKEFIEDMMQGHILVSAELIGLYKKQR